MPPLLLTPADEQILRALHTYRFMTVEDVVCLLYSKGALTHVRGLLKKLSGEDYEEGRPLYRFRLPTVRGGNPERVYTLGTAGREYAERHLGLSQAWQVRPDRARVSGYHHLHHNLQLTRVLVAAARWARGEEAYRLIRFRTSYELAGVRKLRELPAIPDGWLLFERVRDGLPVPVLLEIDRGTEYQVKFKEHVKSRIDFIQSGQYQEIFAVTSVMVVYLTTISENRRALMTKWTEELLTELDLKAWAAISKFGYVEEDAIYELGLFTEKMWHKPFQKIPVSLFS